jgi:hypothetical protein
MRTSDDFVFAFSLLGFAQGNTHCLEFILNMKRKKKS